MRTEVEQGRCIFKRYANTAAGESSNPNPGCCMARATRPYLCTTCNAYAGCYKCTDKPMGKVANTVLHLKRQKTHQIFDSFWKKRGWTRSAAYRRLVRHGGVHLQILH